VRADAPATPALERSKSDEPEPSTPTPASAPRSTQAPLLEPTAPPSAPTTKPNGKGKHAAVVAEIFTAWADARKVRHPKGLAPILDAKRSKVIEARLRDGFDAQVLAHAAAGIWSDAFSTGDNDRGREFADITIALRDAEHVEKFERIWRDAQPPAPRLSVVKAAPPAERELTPAEREESTRIVRDALAKFEATIEAKPAHARKEIRQ
jgi:hypothetical protein